MRALLLTLAPKMEQAGFRQDWLSYLARRLDQAHSLEDRRAEAELNLQVGYLHLRLRQLDQARIRVPPSRKKSSRNWTIWWAVAPP